MSETPDQEQSVSMKEKTELFLKAWKENPYSETTKLLAKAIGYEIVIRQGKPYIRRIGDKFVGGAMESAYWFGKINHENNNHRGVVIKPNGTIQNVVAVRSAQEIKGSKYTRKKSILDEIEDSLNDEII